VPHICRYAALGDLQAVKEGVESNIVLSNQADDQVRSLSLVNPNGRFALGESNDAVTCRDILPYIGQL
jgi:hypothetical protein